LIRSQSYVRDVSFFIKLTSTDSVDITIRELDVWSKTIDGNILTSSVSLSITDKNFLGLGHEWQNNFSRYHSSGDYSYNTNYFIPNIRNTYINSNIHYDFDVFRNYTKGVTVSRPFFSAYAKWAAGISFTQQLFKYSEQLIDSSYIQQRSKINTQDYWVGYAFQLFKGNTENLRSTNLIVAIGFMNIEYLEKPFEAIGVQKKYSNEEIYLVSVGISTRKYVQDKSIFKFGVTEDVPIGRVYSITTGFQNKYNTNRMYLSGRISIGNYYHWGYLSSNFEYSSFIRKSHTEEGVATIGLNYFTGLYKLRRWKIRQFIKPQVSIGINRINSDSLTLNDGVGLDGFQSVTLSGNSRLLLTLQTQLYSPWNLIGFRFGPYITYSCGMLSNKGSGFEKSKLYSQIGLGVLIKNENLVFRSFQISIAFYPLIPGIGQNVFKTNSFKTTDFGFCDFEVEKPSIVNYR